jgi:hypothetical protein
MAEVTNTTRQGSSPMPLFYWISGETDSIKLADFLTEQKNRFRFVFGLQAPTKKSILESNFGRQSRFQPIPAFRKIY